MIENLTYLKGSSAIGPHLTTLEAAERDWAMVVFQPELPVLEGELHLLQQATNRRMRDLLRGLYPTGGILQDIEPQATGIANEVRVHTANKAFYAIADGIMKPVYAYDDPATGVPSKGGNRITLPVYTGTPHTELVYLEIWFEEVKAPTGGVGLDSQGAPADADTTVYEYGMVANRTLNNDIKPTVVPLAETSRRVQLRGALKVVSGSSLSGVLARGVAGYGYGLVADTSFYRAGSGTETSGDDLDTVDGYAYALPLFTIDRDSSTVSQDDITVVAPLLVVPGDVAPSVADLLNRMTEAEADIVSLAGRMSAAEADILTLINDLDVLETDYAAHVANTTTAHGASVNATANSIARRNAEGKLSVVGGLSNEASTVLTLADSALTPTANRVARFDSGGHLRSASPWGNSNSSEVLTTSDTWHTTGAEMYNRLVRRDGIGRAYVSDGLGNFDRAVLLREIYHEDLRTNTPFKLVQRDGFGCIKISNPNEPLDGANKAYVDAAVAGVVMNAIGAIPNVTTSEPGFMIPADKIKLDAATSLPTASAIARRDANGRLRVATPSHADDATNVGYVTDQLSSLQATLSASITSQVTALHNNLAPQATKPHFVTAHLSSGGGGSASPALPAGWSVSSHLDVTAPNVPYIRVTHGLGNTNYAVQATSTASPFVSGIGIPFTVSRSANSFDIFLMRPPGYAGSVTTASISLAVTYW